MQCTKYHKICNLECPDNKQNWSPDSIMQRNGQTSIAIAGLTDTRIDDFGLKWVEDSLILYSGGQTYLYGLALLLLDTWQCQGRRKIMDTSVMMPERKCHERKVSKTWKLSRQSLHHCRLCSYWNSSWPWQRSVLPITRLSYRPSAHMTIRSSLAISMLSLDATDKASRKH